MNTKVIDECTTGSLEGRLTFPEIVQKLMGIGIERYFADLVRMEKVYYTKSCETYIGRMPIQGLPPLAVEFDTDMVKQAIKAIQSQEIAYPEFLRRLIAAGCTSYAVLIDGRQTTYYGRKGEFYADKFPNAKV